jgi:hypothetical protein
VIIEATDLKGLKSDLAHLDEVSTKLGFFRGQWEYYRATYDLKIEDKQARNDYFLRINTRAVSGKLESPYTILTIEDVYIGVGSFPHGVDYNAPIPEPIMNTAKQKLSQLQQLIAE